MTQKVLGIDGGGTRTRAVIVDENGRFCGAGVSGPSNYDDVGIATAQANIGQAVAAARRTADLPPDPFAAAFLGMAGVVSPTDRAVIHQMAAALNLAAPENVGVDHDCRVALAGGLSGRPGMVQIVGTGSSTFGLNAAGDSWRSGGWGHLISDEGSSYWLGIQAMRAAVCAFDGRIAHTSLLAKVQAHLQLPHLNDLMRRLYVVGLSRAEIAGLAPLTIEAAREGDSVALSFIEQGTRYLAECVLAVAQKLGFAAGPCELAMVGGLFQAGEVFIRPFTAAVHRQLPHCRILPAELPPALGAGVLALQLLDLTIDEAVAQALRQAAQQLG